MGGVVAGYRTLAEFMRREYIPGARATIAAASLPRGREYYAHLVKAFTTLDVTPEEVHRSASGKSRASTARWRRPSARAASRATSPLS